jgi:hypothetical protein
MALPAPAKKVSGSVNSLEPLLASPVSRDRDSRIRVLKPSKPIQYRPLNGTSRSRVAPRPCHSVLGPEVRAEWIRVDKVDAYVGVGWLAISIVQQRKPTVSIAGYTDYDP